MLWRVFSFTPPYHSTHPIKTRLRSNGAFLRTSLKTALTLPLTFYLNSTINPDMPVISPLTAQEMAARSHEARRRNKELREMSESQAQPMPQIAEPSPKDAEITRIRDHIEALNGQLDSCTDPEEWDMLTRSKERLFKQWVYLAGIPGPGNLKPTQAKARAQSWSEPTPVQPSTPPVVSPPDITKP